MTRVTHWLVVTGLTTCLITLPSTDARADQTGSEQDTLHAAPGLILHRLSLFGVRDSRAPAMWSTPAFLPGQSPGVRRQAVASTSQHNFILGATAAGLVVTGVALIAYSTTPSCKQNQAISSRCDRDKVIGAIGISTGSVMFVLWALSK